MELATALNIVHDLAAGNIISEKDLPDENQRQVEALKVVREFINELKMRVKSIEN